MNAIKGIAVMSMVATMASAGYQALEFTKAESISDDSGATLAYQIFVPANVPADKKIPLVLFLHGAGERGNDNTNQVKHGAMDLIRYAQSNEAAVIIFPQCPKDKKWAEVNWNAPSHTMPEQPSSSMALIFKLLEEKTNKLPIDKSRIYVTGISMGGYGTWDILQRKPGYFAAAMPICGGGDLAGAPIMKSTPIWTVHGDQDKAVPVSRSRDMVAALKACEGNIQYTEIPGAGHDVWTRTYADISMIKWLFSQRLKK
jgi:predicted peptidase